MRRSLWLLFFCACSKDPGAAPDAAVADAFVADAFVADTRVEDAAVEDAADAAVIVPDPYTITVFDQARISSNGADENFQHVRATLDFASGPFADVKMVLALDTTCYPFEKWQNNPPPPGENWPADCDAFDRNFEVTLDPQRTSTEAPGIELVRAITPFGGPELVEIDVTDVANGLPGAHRVEVVIPTYSDGAGQVSGSNGGWNVSLRFEVTPGAAPRNVLAVVPLVNTTHFANTTTTAFAFDVPAGTASGKIEYRATGHGGAAGGSGCIGPAEEFCHRMHALSVDGTLLDTLDAWRDDCATLCTVTHFGPANGGFDYCLENPCGAIQSVRAPRANWCPGSVTPPELVSGDPLNIPGPHVFDYAINRVIDGGLWRISAVFFAFGP